MKLFRNWTLTWREMGLLKVTLISIGILLGIYFYSDLVTLMWLWWMLAVVGTVYFVTVCFRKS